MMQSAGRLISYGSISIASISGYGRLFPMNCSTASNRKQPKNPGNFQKHGDADILFFQNYHKGADFLPLSFFCIYDLFSKKDYDAVGSNPLQETVLLWESMMEAWESDNFNSRQNSIRIWDVTGNNPKIQEISKNMVTPISCFSKIIKKGHTTCPFPFFTRMIFSIKNIMTRLAQILSNGQLYRGIV
jgi:hypothetical protein